MKKIDVIIDALTSYTERTVDVKSGTRRMCCGDSIEEKHTQHCRGLQALAAARELKIELAKLAEPLDYVEPPTSNYHNGWEEGFEAAKNLFKGKNT
jgi:hypothetical protein